MRFVVNPLPGAKERKQEPPTPKDRNEFPLISLTSAECFLRFTSRRADFFWGRRGSLFIFLEQKVRHTAKAPCREHFRTFAET